jgi:hypothetical protein
LRLASLAAAARRAPLKEKDTMSLSIRRGRLRGVAQISAQPALQLDDIDLQLLDRAGCASISAMSSSRDGCSDPDTAHDQYVDGSRSSTDTPEDHRAGT